ncbi:Gamma-interferon-inducible lysosomal thiol reductase [Sesbania bispinosa]|nr:Gamma-interferon-inducible lysosomal thiol reductase [Sesbania bispinosa]
MVIAGLKRRERLEKEVEIRRVLVFGTSLSFGPATMPSGEAESFEFLAIEGRNKKWHNCLEPIQNCFNRGNRIEDKSRMY